MVQGGRASLVASPHPGTVDMRTRLLTILATVVLAAASQARAVDGPQPEIQRPDATPQTVGATHTLRTIPEACVRLEGVFTDDAAAPYRFHAVSTGRCAQRAAYVETDAVPDAASGWILNDRIRVPRADAPTCVATIDIWRKPGDTAPPALDAQGRSRIYLDKPQKPAKAPMFTAVLGVAGCGRESP
jgi:hypothetical protein